MPTVEQRLIEAIERVAESTGRQAATAEHIHQYLVMVEEKTTGLSSSVHQMGESIHQHLRTEHEKLRTDFKEHATTESTAIRAMEKTIKGMEKECQEARGRFPKGPWFLATFIKLVELLEKKPLASIMAIVILGLWTAIMVSMGLDLSKFIKLITG